MLENMMQSDFINALWGKFELYNITKYVGNVYGLHGMFCWRVVYINISVKMLLAAAEM